MLYVTSKPLTNASQIFRWQVTDAIYLPAGEYIESSWYFLNILNLSNLCVKQDLLID